MKEEITKRVLQAAAIMIRDRSNVREVAKRLGVSKSTVHQDLAYRLPEINHFDYLTVKKIFEINKNEKHLRGGAKTKSRFAKLKKKR